MLSGFCWEAKANARQEKPTRTKEMYLGGNEKHFQWWQVSADCHLKSLNMIGSFERQPQNTNYKWVCTIMQSQYFSCFGPDFIMKIYIFLIIRWSPTVYKSHYGGKGESCCKNAPFGLFTFLRILF